MEGSLKDGLSLSVGRFSLDVLHTPGHTPGSVCFLVRDATVGCLFAGDTLFRESIGRTDLWGGDSDGILRSIRERLLTLPEETRVVTGHGDDTTIGHERGFNPFLRRRF
jgi:glyoxylase-like metal-dependent hydrolase (beta-lactamase superfamily II)